MMKIIPTIKRIGRYIIIGLFWIAIAVTFISGCFGTFFKSANDKNDDFEEYIHGNIP